MYILAPNSTWRMVSNLLLGCFMCMHFLVLHAQQPKRQTFDHVKDSLIERVNYLDSLRRVSHSETHTNSDLSLYNKLYSTIVNLYDINLYNDEHAKRYADLAYKLAVTYKQSDDVLRSTLMYPSRDSDELYSKIEQINKLLPKSEKKEGVLAYLQYLYFSALLTNNSEVDNDSLINDVLRRKGTVIFDEDANRYERFSVMRTVIEGSHSIGPTSAAYRYMMQLHDIVHGFPRVNSYITLDFLQFQVRVHTENEEHHKAVEILKKWQKLSKKREKYIRNRYKRPYYDYGVLYGDMAVQYLLNYKAINKQQVDSCYQAFKRAMKRYPVLKEDYAETSAYKLCYHLGMGHKQIALKLVRRMVRTEDFLDMTRLRVYRIYNELTKELGDSDHSKALAMYAEELEKTYKFVRTANQKDNLVFYRLQQLQTETHQLAEQKRLLEEIKDDQSERSYRIIVTLLLVIIFAVLSLSALIYSRNRKILSHEKMLQKALREAEISNELQTKFLHNMSHEIRTPLNAIVGFSQVLVEDDELLDDEREEYCERIILNNELLMQIIDDILDIARLESGAYKMFKEKVQINKLCKRAVASVRNKCAPNVELNFYSECDDEFEYIIDPHRLLQVLTNLMTNAAKYTDQGSIELTVWFSDDRTQLCFAVADTGSGIPEDLWDALFDRFSKGEEFETGTGLGLNICRVLTEMFNGNIYYDKTYKAGARFVLELPVES